MDEASLWPQHQLQPVSSSPFYYVIALRKLTEATSLGKQMLKTEGKRLDSCKGDVVQS